MKPAQSQLRKRFLMRGLPLITAMMFLGCAQSAYGQWASASPNPNNIYYNGGNVGIGTPAPAYPLDVTGASLRVRMFPSTGTQDVKLHMSNTGGDFFIGIDSSTAGFFGTGNYAPSIYSNINAPMNFYTNNAFRMTIGSTGNVGIGTTSPGDKLTIAGASGNITLGQTAFGSGDYNAFFLNGLTGTGNYNFISKNGDQNLYINRPSGKDIYFRENNSIEQLFLKNGGNVGIGTTSPYSRLSNTTSNIVDNAGGGNGTLSSGFTWSVSGQGYAAAIQQTDSSSNARNGLLVKTAATDASSYVFRAEGGSGGHHFIVRADGKVGIGTNNPGYKLDVNGDTNVQGNITASGSIAAKYQDVAEWVPSSEQLAVGTVVVLDSTKSNHIVSSSVSYDTRVAGVISAQPGITLGEKGDSKVLVATTGRVKVKVDASKGPIHIGDLLVTSDVPGVAMKSEPVEFAGRKMHMPGTLIGKALEPLTTGKGEILVLLSLQ